MEQASVGYTTREGSGGLAATSVHESLLHEARSACEGAPEEGLRPCRLSFSVDAEDGSVEGKTEGGGGAKKIAAAGKLRAWRVPPVQNRRAPWPTFPLFTHNHN